MEMMTLLSVGALVGVVVGVVVCMVLYKMRLGSRSRSILDEARAEAETIKRDKMLEVKEKFISMKADLEKQMAVRSTKVQRPRRKPANARCSSTSNNRSCNVKRPKLNLFAPV